MSAATVPSTQRPTSGAAAPPPGGGGLDPAAYARLYQGGPYGAGAQPLTPARGFFGQTKQERGATGHQPWSVRTTTINPATGQMVTRDGTKAFYNTDLASVNWDETALDPSLAMDWQGLVNANIGRARRLGQRRPTVLDWSGTAGANAVGTPPPQSPADTLQPSAPTTNRLSLYARGGPSYALPTDRQPPPAGVPQGGPVGDPASPAGGFLGPRGYPGGNLNSPQAWLGSRGYVVGQTASALHPDYQKLTWADIAAAAGIQDFQGSLDPRLTDLQAAYWGHDTIQGQLHPERSAMKQRILAAFQANPAFGAQQGGGGGGMAGLPALARGGVIPKAPTPAGQIHHVAGRPVIAGEEQPEAVLPLSVLQNLVVAAAQHGAQQGVKHGAQQGVKQGVKQGGAQDTDELPIRSKKQMNPGLTAGPQVAAAGPSLPHLAGGGVVFNPGRDPAPRHLYGAPGGDDPPPGFGWRNTFAPGTPPPSDDPSAGIFKFQPPQPPGAGAGGNYMGTPPPDINTLYANPYGEGGSYTPFAGYTPASYTPYQQQAMSPEEQKQLSAITALARQLEGQGTGLYGVGSQAYSDAIRYYQTLLKGNRAAMTAAVAPTAEMLREQGQAQLQTTASAVGRGGARDAALADVGRQTSAGIAELTRGVQPGAAQALSGAGLAGAQAGAGIQAAGGGFYQSALQSLTQHRQFEQGLGESSRQFGAGLTEQSRQFGTGLQESSKQFAAQLAEQVRQGNMSWQQAQQGLALQGWLANEQMQQQWTSYYESIRQFNEQLRIQREQISAQRSAGRGQLIGAGIGAAGGIAVALI